MLSTDRHRVTDCNIGVRHISDHAALYLTIHLDAERKERVWRLNSSFLNDAEFQMSAQKEFEDYKYHNNNKNISPSALWNAAKAVLRGKLIMWSSVKKKVKEKHITDKVMDLKLLEKENITNNNADSLKRLNSPRRTF